MKALVVGANRGELHALAYKNIPDMEVVALCDLKEEKVRTLATNMGVRWYTDYETALEKEKPDIVHAVTSPAVPRALWIEPAAKHNVKALVLEKPYALTPAEKHFVDSEGAEHPQMHVIVNHQRRYMDFAQRLRLLLRQNALGEIKHIYGQAQGEIMEMGTHLFDLVLMAAGDVRPESIWATASGGRMYSERHLKCPDDMLCQMVFPERIRATVDLGIGKVAKPDFREIQPEHADEFHANRCSIYVYGSQGGFWWREYGDWGFCNFVQNGVRSFLKASDYTKDDPVAQIKLTEGIKEALENRVDHQCEFKKANMGLTSLFGAYKSALMARRLTEFDLLEPPPILAQDEWETLRSRLTGRLR